MQIRVPSWAAALAFVALTAAGCTSGGPDETLPARVNALPTAVTGLGPAVFLTRVPDKQRSDLFGLRAVDHFGDDIAAVTPVRRHVEVALGDPRIPAVVRGLAEDPQDALLNAGRVIDTTLPEHLYAERVASLSPAVAATGSDCVTVGPDLRLVQPAVGASCVSARYGGAYWTPDSRSQYGGINLATGASTNTVDLPDYPIAASADGRYLATVADESGQPDRLVIADTTAGTSKATVPVLDGKNQPGVFTADGYATVHLVDERPALSIIGPTGTVRTLLSPVGDVAFAPDGKHVLVVDTGGPQSRLAVVDLPSGTVRPVTDSPELGGRVTATVAGQHALVAEIHGYSGLTAPVATRAWSVDLTAARLRPVPGTPNATAVEAADPDGDLAALDRGPAADALAALHFSPSGETFAISADGAVSHAPPLARPALALPGGRALYLLPQSDHRDRTRDDLLLVVDGSGRRTEIRTGAGERQALGGIVPTPDGGHLLVSLRATRGHGYPNPGPLDQVVLIRIDGTADPLVLYRSAVLASLATTPS